MPRSIDEQILASATSPNTFDMFQIGSDGEVSIKLDLDMMFTLDQFRDLNRPANKSSGKAVFTKNNWHKWPSNTVYYQFVPDSLQYKNTLLSAMEHYKKFTCLNFIESSSSQSRVLIVAEGGCWSYVGNLHTVQKLSMAWWCNNLQGALHEMGHAIGYNHEQLRTDRDSYIRFQYAYQGQDKNNRIMSESIVHTLGTRYDYKSVMHYSKRHGITTLDPAYQNIIGTIQHLSFNDIKAVNLWYECASTAGQCPYVTCPFNGFVMFKLFKNVSKCQCWCDSGNNYDPLVPCANITQEVPAYNIPTSSTNSELNKTLCADMRIDCVTLKKKGGCSSNLRTMYTQCTKTCNFCGKGNNLCMDYEDGCHMMAGSGACKDYGLKETMDRVCRKSCGLCQTPATPCDIQDTLF